MDELKQPERLVNKAKLHAFKKKTCQCFLCKPTKCGHDVVAIASMGGTSLYLCGNCARMYHKIGWKIERMAF